MLLALGGAAFAAVAVVVTTASVVVLQREENTRTKQEFEAYKLETGLKLAEAQARQREAELKLYEVREQLGRPRTVNEEEFKKAVANVPRRKVVISYTEDDPDSSWLSLGIDGALRRAGWDVTTLISMPHGVALCSRGFGGIYVMSKELLSEEAEFFAGRALRSGPTKLPNTALFGLTDALNISIGKDSAHFSTCPLLSDDSLYVAIRPRWVIFPKEPKPADPAPK